MCRSRGAKGDRNYPDGDRPEPYGGDYEDESDDEDDSDGAGSPEDDSDDYDDAMTRMTIDMILTTI